MSKALQVVTEPHLDEHVDYVQLFVHEVHELVERGVVAELQQAPFELALQSVSLIQPTHVPPLIEVAQTG